MLRYKARGTIRLGIDDRSAVAIFTPAPASIVEDRKSKRAVFLRSELYDGGPAVTTEQATALTKALATALTTALSPTSEEKMVLETVLMEALTDAAVDDMVQERLDKPGNVIVRLPTDDDIDVKSLVTAVANAGSSHVEVEVCREERTLRLVGFR